MALETTTILRTILFQIKTAATLADAIRAVEVMCSGDDIAVVDKKVEEHYASKNK
jgi:hypothetical protein